MWLNRIKDIGKKDSHVIIKRQITWAELNQSTRYKTYRKTYRNLTDIEIRLSIEAWLYLLRLIFEAGTKFPFFSKWTKETGSPNVLISFQLITIRSFCLDVSPSPWFSVSLSLHLCVTLSLFCVHLFLSLFVASPTPYSSIFSVYQFLCKSVSVSVSLPISLCLFSYLIVSLSLSISISLSPASFNVSPSLYICLLSLCFQFVCICVYMYPSLSLYLHLSVFLPSLIVCLFDSLFLSLFFHVSLFLCLSISLYLSLFVPLHRQDQN